MKIAQWVKTSESAALPYTRLPAYTAVPMLFAMVYARTWTVMLAMSVTLFTLWMVRKGYTLFWLYLRLHGRLHGNRLSARPIWHIRRFSFLSDPSKDT